MALRTLSICAGVDMIDDPKERQRQHVRNWRAKNKSKVSDDNRARHERNRAANLERKRRYYQQVRKAKDATEQGRWKDRDKKARRRQATSSGSLTYDQWISIVTRHEGRCAYCHQTGVALEQDHVIALSKGGAHAESNVVPACKPCNSRKGNR